ncbi:MAG: hypothetical protein KC475_12405 [Cyanobacteria bacterium HKST-UBA03]|nr:hypothetical protein [Cyanobacteria bacterium HKST-UBA03]
MRLSSLTLPTPTFGLKKRVNTTPRHRRSTMHAPPAHRGTQNGDGFVMVGGALPGSKKIAVSPIPVATLPKKKKKAKHKAKH